MSTNYIRFRFAQLAAGLKNKDFSSNWTYPTFSNRIAKHDKAINSFIWSRLNKR